MGAPLNRAAILSAAAIRTETADVDGFGKIAIRPMTAGAREDFALALQAAVKDAASDKDAGRAAAHHMRQLVIDTVVDADGERVFLEETAHDTLRSFRPDAYSALLAAVKRANGMDSKDRNEEAGEEPAPLARSAPTSENASTTA